MPDEEILTIENKHGESCGEPPDIDFTQADYISYFENTYGEQSLLVVDEESDLVSVYIADAGWESPIEVAMENVVKGIVSNVEDQGILPNEDEKDWLKACKSVIKSRYKHEYE